MKVRFLAPAEVEYLEALAYHTRQSTELADAFLEDLEHTVNLLGEYPLIGARYDVDKRRIMLRHFHYSLIYEIGPDEIVVVAVMH